MNKIEDNNILVISDVDGCLTDGNFIYTSDGKVAKIYGAHDADGLKLLKKNSIDVKFITADKRGFPITNKRITDMKGDLSLVSESERMHFISQYINNFLYNNVVFFGDGIFDAEVKKKFKDKIIFIAPNNGRKEAKEIADYVTESDGGHGAFLDLAIYIVNKFKK